ncbi:CYTH and CHAD domain-containing protein [Acrocarpospora catenulata]|uniref:CYTH and CHAD domain-containing protein n=1 Tax=Acrocarpospora catenulata TaxID=2836182 RepID=UPI001BDA2DE7|nr:CYTH and CHAD domain-containing protein [Acrocarpospora catenulata]
MAIEIEDKFDIPDEFQVPDLSDLKGTAGTSGPRTYTLIALYFDTPDLRLAARGITLRRRRGGDDAGWHLKLPKAKGVRQEVVHPLTRSTKTVPPELAELVQVYTRGAELVPVAQLETKRSVTRVLGADGEVLAEIADDRVKGTVFGEPPVAARWREVETELVKGEEKLLRRLGKRLGRAGAVPAASANKLARLFGDAVPVRPVTAAPAGTAGAVVVDYFQSQVAHLIAHDVPVRHAEPDAVHQARVACRRMRSTLKAFATLIEGTEGLQEELRWLGAVLGEVRDLEVIRARFAKHLSGLDEGQIVGPIRERLGTDLEVKEEAAYEQVRQVMAGERYFALLDAIEAPLALTARAARPAGPTLEKIVGKQWQRVEKRYATAQAMPDEAERELAMHDVRKAAKQARYTAEAVGMTQEAARAEAVQEVLGLHQDGVVAQQTLAEEAERARQAGEDTFTYGVLAGIEHETAERANKKFPSIWAKVTGQKATG